MELSSVVYIFHKCIISYVLCGYEVQINMQVFGLSESPPLTNKNRYCENIVRSLLIRIDVNLFQDLDLCKLQECEDSVLR